MSKRVWAYAGVLVAGAAVAGAGVAAGGPADATPTFTKDVAPILYERCVSCHRSGSIAPMSLLTYQEARPWAKSIKDQVAGRTMPPWFADPKHRGQFDNDPSLTQEQIDTIVAWANAGAPKGDDTDMPPPPKFPEGWTMGEPDLVLSMQEAHKVPADGVVPYLYFKIPTNFTDDKWVQAVEVRPGNPEVVHHVIAYTVDTKVAEGGDERAIQRGVAGEGNLAGFTPNRLGLSYPPGIARRIRAGSYIVFQMHYTPNGAETTDRTSIGLVFAKGPVQKTLRTGLALNARFVIPPGDPSFEVRSSTTFSEDVHLLTFMPHMHLRGKDFTYTAVYPDGRTEVLLQVPTYDFNWQINYKFKQPVAMPKGSRLECLAHFDNSPGNKANPDPKAEVRWGDQTWEEMMIGWFNYTRDGEQITTPTPAPVAKHP